MLQWRLVLCQLWVLIFWRSLTLTVFQEGKASIHVFVLFPSVTIKYIKLQSSNPYSTFRHCRAHVCRTTFPKTAVNFLKFQFRIVFTLSMLRRNVSVVEILTCSSVLCKKVSCWSSFYGWLFNKISSSNIPSWTQTNIYWIQNLSNCNWNIFSLVCV